MTITDTSSRFKQNPLTHSRLGLLGAMILLAMLVACLGTLPYTMGMRADPADPQGRSRPRFDLHALEANLLPPSWTPYSPAEQQRYDSYFQQIEQSALSSGAAAHRPFYLLGTDALGRDFFVRCLAGGGVSLGIGIAAALIAVFIGTTYGMIAGYAGGRVDALLMRIVDVLYGLPYILLVVLLAVGVDGLIDRAEASALGAQMLAAQAGRQIGTPWWLEFIREHRNMINVLTLLVAIGGVSWLTMARVIRGQVLSLKSQPFMEASRAIGVPVVRQFLRHLLPNLLGPITVYATLTVPQAILQESFLSFLGIGIQEPLPSWGNLASHGLSQLNPVASRWWLLLWPCALLGTTLLALNFLGEGLREAFDPKQRPGNRA